MVHKAASARSATRACRCCLRQKPIRRSAAARRELLTWIVRFGNAAADVTHDFGWTNPRSFRAFPVSRLAF